MSITFVRSLIWGKVAMRRCIAKIDMINTNFVICPLPPEYQLQSVVEHEENSYDDGGEFQDRDLVPRGSHPGQAPCRALHLRRH